MQFATVRLGKTSVNDIRKLASMPQGVVADAMTIDVICTQVPEDLSEGTVVFVWLGSDNSKGAPTDWIQGFKVVGLVSSIKRGAKYNDESTTTLSLKYAFNESITRLDVLRDCPEAYYWCSSLPVIGLDDHSNQTIRCFPKDSERGEIGAFLYALNIVHNGFRKEIVAVIPELGALFWNSIKSPKAGEIVVPHLNLTGLSFPHQRITYGAPGTGKSHGIEEIVSAYPDTVRTTFHPDSDYATFVGCYKPTMIPQVKYGLQGKPIEQGGKEVTEEVIAYSYVPQAFTKAYVRAWRKMTPGPDGKIAPQFLVIEEINRGNCAQIFGDLFQLLDRDGTHYSKYAIEADSDLAKYIAKELSSASASIPDEIRSGKILKLPPNLYIWATMNTSDQSLFPMDSAFKRRWEWEYIPIKDFRKNWKIVAGGTSFPWWGFIDTVNKYILDTLKNEDKQLGYFFARPDDDASDTIEASKFVNKVLFYLYNDVFKDYDLPKGFAKPDGKGKFAFKDFFLADGKPDEVAVKDLLTSLLVQPQ